MMGARPLDGILVVEVGQHFGVDYCTKLLSDNGAEVVKIEPPGGDPVRWLPPFAKDTPGVETSGIFQHINSGKKSVVLDLGTGKDQESFKKIASRADVIVDGFSPAAHERGILGLSSGSKGHRRTIRASITLCGLSGPYVGLVGGELSALALGGCMYVHGESGREPIMLAGHQAHYHSGSHTAIAILAALMRREMTGRAAEIEVSIVECVAFLLSGGLRAYHRNGEIYKRSGSRLFYVSQEPANPPPPGPLHYPSTILPCKDGYVFVHTAGAGIDDLAVMMDEPRLAAERFKQAARGQGHADEMDNLMLPWLSRHTKMEVFELAQTLRLSCGAVLTTKDVLENEHFRAREWFVTVSHPVMGDIEMQSTPILLQKTPGRVERAPMLGEHTEEVMADLRKGAALV